MAKMIPVERRLTAPVLTMLSLAVRAQVEQLATRDGVSLSEIARRAVLEYLKRQDKRGTR